MFTLLFFVLIELKMSRMSRFKCLFFVVLMEMSVGKGMFELNKMSTFHFQNICKIQCYRSYMVEINNNV